METACYHCKLALDVETQAHKFLSLKASPYLGTGPGSGPEERLTQPGAPLETDALASLTQVISNGYNPIHYQTPIPIIQGWGSGLNFFLIFKKQ